MLEVTKIHHHPSDRVHLDTATSINPLIATLKLQSNRSSNSNTVTGTLVVDGWAVTFGTARAGCSPPKPLLTVPNVTAHPSTASVPTSYYSM